MTSVFVFRKMSCGTSLYVPLPFWGHGRGEFEEDVIGQENVWKWDTTQSPFFLLQETRVSILHLLFCKYYELFFQILELREIINISGIK